MYDVFYALYETFEEYRRGRAEVLNPADLYVSVAGWHDSYDRYVKWNGSARELAEMQIEGSYTGGTERPFMYMIWEKIDSNKGRYAREIFNDNIEYDRHQRGWIADWDAICYELQTVCIENLMPEVSAELPPIKPSSQKKKNKYGYGGMTMYASYQLVECIEVRAE